MMKDQFFSRMPHIILPTADQLPYWFEYPKAFQSIVNQGLVDFHPWHILDGEQLINQMLGLSKRFPKSDLVPFAQRTDSDVVACFEISNTSGVVLFEDYSRPLSIFQRFDTIQEWFLKAVKDCIDFESGNTVWTQPVF